MWFKCDMAWDKSSGWLFSSTKVQWSRFSLHWPNRIILTQYYSLSLSYSIRIRPISGSQSSFSTLFEAQLCLIKINKNDFCFWIWFGFTIGREEEKERSIFPFPVLYSLRAWWLLYQFPRAIVAWIMKEGAHWWGKHIIERASFGG